MSEQPKTSPHLLRWIIITVIVIILLIFFSLPTSKNQFVDQGIIRVSFLAAFFGGVLSLLAPCSAVLVPAFFAYSFKEKSELVKMTFVFWLGLAALFVPLGFTASFLTKLVLTENRLVFLITGIIFILIGLFSFSNKTLSFGITGPKLGQKRSAGTVFLMGLLFAFASGTCAAPIIGGIFTLAAAQGHTLNAILLLVTYSFGLVIPLLILAWFFDKKNFSRSKLVQGKDLKIPLGFTTWNIHTTKLITGILFIGVGLLFIVSRGTHLLAGAFGIDGLGHVYHEVNEWLLTETRGLPTWPFILGLLAIVGWIIYRRKKLPKKSS